MGYFPSEKPKYSCMVLIDKPNPEIGYYGSDVAVPVLKYCSVAAIYNDFLVITIINHLKIDLNHF